MCCHIVLSIHGARKHDLEPRVRELLKLSGFNDDWIRYDSVSDYYWVQASLTEYDDQYSALTFRLQPTIYSSSSDHSGRREIASVAFRLAGQLAEELGRGVIRQYAPVFSCSQQQGVASLVVASYPEVPLSWENICPGFRKIFLEHL